MKEKLKVNILDIDADKPIVIINKKTAKKLMVRPLSRVNLKTDNKKDTCIVNISDKFTKDNHICVYRNVADKLDLKENNIVDVSAMPFPKSIEYIIKKIRNHSLSQEEIDCIIEDVFKDKLSDSEISAFMTATYIYDLNLEETISFSKSLINVGKKLKFDSDLVLDKHSIGGINGRVSMIVIPIIASLGYIIPKTASRSISSAAGTADCMEVLADVSFSLDRFKEIVEEIGGIVAWNGRLDLSPVDDKLIKVRHDLGLDPEGVVIASVLSKKASAGSTHQVIDLPIGKEVKILTKEDGDRWAKKFLEVSKALGIKTKAVLTDAQTPCGRAFGPALEARGALEILEGKYFDNLAEKSCEIAGELLELVAHCKHGEGYDIAKECIENKKALRKFKEIIKAQNGNIFCSKDIPYAKYKKIINCASSGKLVDMDVSLLTKIARLAGAPKDKLAGVLLLKKIGEKVNKEESLFEIHAESESKLKQAIDSASENLEKIAQFKKMILEEVEN